MLRVNSKFTILLLMLFGINLHSAQVSGLVKDKLTGIQIPGVRITAVGSAATNTDTLVFTTTSGTNGRYSLILPNNSIYTFVASKAGYATLKVTLVFTGDTARIVDFDLTPLNPAINFATVKGAVYKQLSTANSPLKGAIITLSGPSSNLTFSAVSDSAGKFSISNVPYGTYVALCQATGFLTTNQPITVQSTILELVFRLVPTVQTRNLITGKVLDDSSLGAIAGAPVYLKNNDATSTPIISVSGTTGEFNFTGVPAGLYSLSAQMAGYVSNTTGQILTIDSSTVINNLKIYLHKTVTGNFSTVKGVVNKTTTIGFIPAPKAVIKLIGANATSAFTAVSDSTGAFTILNVPYGTYIESCELAGYQSQSITFIVQALATQIMFNLQQLFECSS